MPQNEKRTKVIVFDVYGTILCIDDAENSLPPRQGFAKFILEAKKFGIKTVTGSDADPSMLRLDLGASFKGRVPFGIEVFDRFFDLAMYPKDYRGVLNFYCIQEDQLMIIGDNPVKDLSRAPANASKVLVPPYIAGNDNFNFSQIAII